MVHDTNRDAHFYAYEGIAMDERLVAALELVTLNCAWALRQPTFKPYAIHDVDDCLRQAVQLITYDNQYGQLFVDRQSALRKTGIWAQPDYGLNHAEGRLRLGGFKRTLSGIPYDFIWWTGDPHLLLSY